MVPPEEKGAANAAPFHRYHSLLFIEQESYSKIIVQHQTSRKGLAGLALKSFNHSRFAIRQQFFCLGGREIFRGNRFPDGKAAAIFSALT